MPSASTTIRVIDALSTCRNANGSLPVACRHSSPITPPWVTTTTAAPGPDRRGDPLDRAPHPRGQRGRRLGAGDHVPALLGQQPDDHRVALGEGDPEATALELADVHLAQVGLDDRLEPGQRRQRRRGLRRAVERADEERGHRLSREPLGEGARLRLAVGRQRRVALALDQLERLAGHGGGRGSVPDDDQLGGVGRRDVQALRIARHGGGCWHDGRMLLRELVEASAAVRATSARGGKVAALADLLRRLEPSETPAAVAWLSGVLTQRQIGVGWAALRDAPAPAAEPSLTVAEVEDTFTRVGAMSGSGSQTARRDAVRELLARATEDEQRFLTALLLGDLGQGALAGVMTDAVAKAAELPRADVQRAVMLRGDLGAVAAVALAEGAAGLRGISLELLRPVQPMLASPGDDLDAALERISPAAVEFKLDGIRVQVHRRGDEVRVFTRSLDDITARVPEVVRAARELRTDAAVLDGEAIALRADGRPEPFQVTASAVGSGGLTTMFFDVLHAGGQDLIDAPGAERFAALEDLVPEPSRVPRVLAADADSARAVLDEALARGHEGVIVKSLEAPYAAGRRGAGWLKVKPRHTLDLVVLAVEWGHGRRRGLLSNLHLGARRGADFVMLGKTFKGLTDAMLAWQTEHLLGLEIGREGHVVHVRPELVVEIAFDGVQASTRYPGGVALRFARVLRHRPDKPAAEADTLDAVHAIHAASA